MADQQPEAAVQYGIYVDDKRIDDDGTSLTFREERKMIEVIREVSGDPEADIATAGLHEFALALVVVTKQRDDADYSLENALDLNINDVVREVKPKAARRRPTAGKTPA